MKHIVDTHPLIWHLTGNARLGANADAVLKNKDSQLILPATAYAEACWIVEHGRTNIPSVRALRTALDADTRFMLYPLDRAVIDKCQSLSVIKEMHDRQIVATALCVKDSGETVALLTQDANITESGLVPVVW